MPTAFTIAADGRGVAGDKFVRRGTGNLGVYATNGVAFTKAQLDLPVKVSDIDVDNAGGYIFEVVSLTNTGGLIKAYRDNSVATAAALPEVANAVDLSATTFNWQATGN
jgi:hypothetical protein